MLQDIIAYYREQGAPGEQPLLIELLKEAQAAGGGVLTQAALEEIAQELGVKATMLSALVRRIPALRMADAPHRLEICAGCPKGRELRAWAEDAVKQGGFTYHPTSCMKNCQNGPSARWDGELIPQATVEKLRKLLYERKEKP